MEEKETYRRWCAERREIPLFLRDVWWDAVAPDVWRVWVFDEADGQAFFIFLAGRKSCLRYLIPPQLTPYQGFYLLSGGTAFAEKCQRRLLERLRAMRLSLFEMNVAPGMALSRFEGSGYRRTLRTTYRLYGLSDIGSLWKGIAYKKKAEIRKAERLRLTLTPWSDVAAFYRLMERDHGSVWYLQPWLQRLYEQVCPAHGEMLAAVDEAGECMAAAFLVWDEQTVYYLCCATPREHRQSGASAWLIWQALQRYGERGFSCFDFEGSMVRSIAFSYRRFGAEPVSFDKWGKKNLLGHLACAARGVRNWLPR